MKLIRYLGIFTALFALVSLFSGCDSSPGSEGGGNKPSTANNGSVFYAKVTNNQYLFISIYSEEAGKLIAPKAGSKYAVAVVPVDSDGDLDYSGPPDSEGVIFITNDVLTFTPSENYPGQQTATGALSGNTLAMAAVPGASFKNISLTIRSDVAASPSSPFGKSNGGISLPPTGGGTPPGGGGTPPGGSTPAATFDAGKYVTNVEWLSDNTKPPTTGDIYEGTPVNLGNFQVKVSYNEDYPYYIANKAFEFIVDPPYYYASEGEHTLKYIGEYNDIPASKLTFKAPKAHTAINSETRPANQNIFYKLKDGSVTYSGASSLKYFPGYIEALPNTFQRDTGGLDTTGFALKGTHMIYQTSNTGNTLVPESTPRSLAFTAAVNPTSNKATLTYSKTESSGSYTPVTTSVDLVKDYVYTLESIVVSEAPFKQQITFDDPRFFPKDDATAKRHWFGHMTDAKIGLSYKEISTPKTIKVIEAAMKTSNPLTFTAPEDFKNTEDDPRYLKFTYMTKETNDKVEIPVYDTLAKIDIDPISSGTIVLDGTTYDNFDISFLSKVTVYAVYQKGSNKNASVRKPIFVKERNSPTTVFNRWTINGTYKHNVNQDTANGGILNAANSNSYNKNQKLVKAQIDFFTRDGSITETMPLPSNWPDNYPAPKSNTISIGVKGYGQSN